MLIDDVDDWIKAYESTEIEVVHTYYIKFFYRQLYPVDETRYCESEIRYTWKIRP